ncbi:MULTISPECIES: hypothetical protein [Acinetobacter]|uniref:Uncharacterized protein n=1 Tax=Acinetobacter junii TaxID=40215 RepID=A0A365PMG0_ACIJU|nr:MULTISPECIES: hypothetical protein [Acinetobacter]RBA42366.1 hypothetical protein DDF86_00450 [Acinetobacter junii]RBA42936.1 hypothetical protein DDG62_01695 [Acinetobacter junii]RBA49841.1 hypothetical protein DC346_02075 [Acinetobacter junii]WLF73439.1 hypothetical protein Q4617_05360 [Acinetobacter junii]
MDIHELKQFESVYQPSKEIAFCWGVKKYVQLSVEENHTEIVDHANNSLRIWQAAKAQAVPEGFVLVNKKDLVKVLNCVTDDWLVDTDSFEEFKKIESLVQDEVNAMIEPQEPAND